MYLDRQFGVYYAQVRIPNDPGLRELLGKTAFRKTLQTKNKRVACELAKPFVLEWKAAISEARELLKKENNMLFKAKTNGKKFIHIDAPITLNEYQESMSDTAIYKWPVIYPALGLANEAGECLGKIKKMIRDDDVRFDGTSEITPEQRSDIAAEIGDVLWYIAALSKDLGLTLEYVGQMNLDKLADRKIRSKLKGSGDNR